MSKYRRIEISAYQRRVTVVSGEWRPGDLFDAEPARTEQVLSLDDSDSCEPVEPESPEGQLILLEAVRSLEQRLSPEARALIGTGQNNLAESGRSNFKRFFSRLRSFFKPNDLHLSLERNPAVKQSVED